MGRTIAEKIFASHLVDQPSDDMHVIRLDAVFCHEITTPIAINDLMSRGKDRVFDPSKIKAVIDHVTPAKDSNTAIQGKILHDRGAHGPEVGHSKSESVRISMIVLNIKLIISTI